MGNSTSVTLREFARRNGRSHTWVQNKVKSGELPRNDDGSIPVEEGFKAFNAIVREVEQKKANRQKQQQTVEALPDNDEAPMTDNVTKAMNVTEAFNKVDRIVGGIFIVDGVFRFELGRGIFLFCYVGRLLSRGIKKQPLWL